MLCENSYCIICKLNQNFRDFVFPLLVWQIIMAVSLITRFGLWFSKLNIFESGTTDIEIIRQERWSTKLFIAVFLILTIVFTVYGSLDKQTTQVTVYGPSFDTFLSLQQKYPTTLNCPCANVAITFGSFTQIEPSFHQVLLYTDLVRLKKNLLIK